ncbi:MAG: hypothetical protein F6K58_27125 [Symploca sp. SIO2E9]|nr:hypothetical protein [Symploca sp. SIO2E9]
MRRRGDTETRRRGDTETRRHGDAETGGLIYSRHLGNWYKLDLQIYI